MIPIKKVKQIREDLNLTNIVIFGIDENLGQYVFSHGKTTADARRSAAFANHMRNFLKWPENMCNSKPIERICENCDYLRWNEKGDVSACMYEPQIIMRRPKDRACSHFEPKY